MNDMVASVRGVGCKKGYPYYAVGIYQRTPRADGSGYYWRLVAEGSDWHRTERACWRGIREQYESLPTAHVHHGYPA